MQLKISSITNLTDARYFSAIGAHYLGFCFDVLNENNISIAKVKEIINWLHEPVIVGEFGIHQTKEEIQFIAKELDLNEIQIPFLHPQKNELNFDKFLVMDDFLSLIDCPSLSDWLVLKPDQYTLKNPTTEEFLSNNKIFIDVINTDTTTLHEIKAIQPYGIQITCKKEDKAGISLVDEYEEIIEMISF